MLQVLDEGFHPDDRIGNYRVEHQLGPTGSGLLLQARHQVLPRRAIIKVVHAAFASAASQVQTLREACILEAIGHPGVPVVYESGLLRDRRPWFAFEVISGPTLGDMLAAGPLSVPEVVSLMRDLAELLEHAHRRGVIHRGLHPDRIVITNHRRFPLCIPDWSEAIAHDASATVPPGDGCRSYVAPELARHDAGGADRVDDRADMFALGAIAYRALTGRAPSDASDDIEMFVAAGDRRPEAPRELTAMIDALLSFDRFDRPSASEVRCAIEWMLRTLPEMQQHAASVNAISNEDLEILRRGTASVAERLARSSGPRLRRPRWTPSVHDAQPIGAGEVDVAIDDDLRLR
jgi:serine/threonine protein kinase